MSSQQKIEFLVSEYLHNYRSYDRDLLTYLHEDAFSQLSIDDEVEGLDQEKSLEGLLSLYEVEA